MIDFWVEGSPRTKSSSCRSSSHRFASVNSTTSISEMGYIILILMGDVYVSSGVCTHASVCESGIRGKSTYPRYYCVRQRCRHPTIDNRKNICDLS